MSAIENLGRELRRLADDSPEFWPFNPPAGPKDIAKAERFVGSLPEPLRELLASANGGYASQNGKTGDCPREAGHSRSLSNVFLSTREIPSAMEQAMAGDLGDGNPAEFDFVPFLSMPDGSLLCLRRSDPDGPVWLAWPGDDPQEWAPVYPSLAALARGYIANFGALSIGSER